MASTTRQLRLKVKPMKADGDAIGRCHSLSPEVFGSALEGPGGGPVA